MQENNQSAAWINVDWVNITNFTDAQSMKNFTSFVIFLVLLLNPLGTTDV